ALLLSGSDDPVTPPAYADEARRGLTNSLHVVLQDFGHGQLAAPCMDRVMEDFIHQGSVAGLDVSCTRNDKPMPFFMSLNGRPPGSKQASCAKPSARSRRFATLLCARKTERS